MARSEAAKRADAKYKSEKTTQFTLRFYPSDEDILAHLQRQESKQGYIKSLIRADMDTWYTTTTHEVECKTCGTIYDYDTVKDLPRCLRCSGGANRADD